MIEYTIRQATLKDIDFIAKVIIEAEKSMTNNLGLANFFEISESELNNYLVQMLKEEVDGCEFSLSSFFVACCEDEPVAALGGWLEGYYDDMPSSVLKANLIGYVFPKEQILKLKNKFELIEDIQIEREIGTYQLEYSYTEDEHRGNKLIQKLMEAHLQYAKQLAPGVKKAQLHVFENNSIIIKVHERSGYHISKRYVSCNQKILDYFPYNVKLLMEKEL